MMNTLFNFLLAIPLVALFFTAIVSFILWGRRKLRDLTARNAIQGPHKLATDLYVDFKDVPVPDLASNQALADLVRIESQNGSSFHLSSIINDRELKELIMKEFKLSPKQVIVSYRQVVYVFPQV